MFSATAPRTIRFYSASKGSSGSSNSASEPETHFGFQTVKESLKASKGDHLRTMHAVMVADTTFSP
jgi:hypothetical protein